MALPEISTGYKPEFGLGALYQGFNAANAEQGAELELIKQFLANQRSMQMNPLEAQTAQQNLDINDYKTAPAYKQAMTDTQVGQSMSSLSAGQTASALQPFKQRAGQGELQNQIRRESMLDQMGQMDEQIQTEQNPLTRMAYTRARDQLLHQLKMTPEFDQKRELRETGTDSAEYIAELRAREARLLAEARAQGSGDKPAKTFEETIQRILAKKRAGEELTEADLAAWAEATNGFNAKVAAKIQPGNIVNPNVAPDVLMPKPQQQQYVPNQPAQQKADPLGIR